MAKTKVTTDRLLYSINTTSYIKHLQTIFHLFQHMKQDEQNKVSLVFLKIEQKNTNKS